MDFLTDFELHKNKSARIVPIALERYFVSGVPVSETINNHNNIFDYCLRQKATKDFHYEGFSKTTGKTVYNKLIRYYLSMTGEKLLKIKNEECLSNAASISQVEAGEWLATVCNYLSKDTKVEECQINYEYYIDKANTIISKIKTHGSKRIVKIIPNQLNMF